MELSSDRAAVRDSKNTGGPVLTAPWPGLVAAVKGDLIRH